MSLGRPRWWQWPTILSLNAPLISAVWLSFIASTLDVPIGSSHTLVLALSVWLAYVADRWIEAWRLPSSAIQTQRHSFSQRRRWPLGTVWLVVLAIDVTIAVGCLTSVDLVAGTLLLFPVLAYVLSHQNLHRRARWRLPKELCVAALLSSGVGLFLVTRATNLLPLVLPLSTFAALCFSNCVLVSVWERHVDTAHAQTSLARDYPDIVGFSQRMPWLIACVMTLLVIFGNGRDTVMAWCAIATCASIVVIDALEPRLGWPLAHTLADVALMTPVVPLIWPG